MRFPSDYGPREQGSLCRLKRERKEGQGREGGLHLNPMLNPRLETPYAEPSRKLREFTSEESFYFF